MRLKIYLVCHQCQTQCLKPGVKIPELDDFPLRQALHIGCTFCRNYLSFHKNVVENWEDGHAHSAHGSVLQITIRKDKT